MVPSIWTVSASRRPSIFHLYIILIPLVFTAYYFASPHNRRTISNIPHAPTVLNQVYRDAATSKKSAFIRNFLESEVGGRFNGNSLNELCESKIWTPGLVFRCEPVPGGVGHVRNIVLNSLRFAIESGATSFILPSFLPTSSQALQFAHPTSKRPTLPFDHIFSTSHFVSLLKTSCPQITVYNSFDELWNIPSLAPAHILSPEELIGTQPNISIISTPGQWRPKFNQWLNNTATRAFSAERPILVSLQMPLFLQWPLSYEAPGLIANFGKLLRFRDDVQILAASIMYAMETTFKLGFNPTLNKTQAGLFYGADLRSSNDNEVARWTPFEMQSSNYLSHASNYGLKVMYVSSGNADEIQRLKVAAQNTSLSVVTKEILLGQKDFGKEAQELASLDSYRKDIVDYEVLSRSSVFGGTWESSFSWNIAMRRHVAASTGDWDDFDDDGVSPQSPGAKAEDESSIELPTKAANAAVYTPEAAKSTENVFSMSEEHRDPVDHVDLGPRQITTDEEDIEIKHSQGPAAGSSLNSPDFRLAPKVDIAPETNMTRTALNPTSSTVQSAYLSPAETEPETAEETESAQAPTEEDWAKAAIQMEEIEAQMKQLDEEYVAQVKASEEEEERLGREHGLADGISIVFGSKEAALSYKGAMWP